MVEIDDNGTVTFVFRYATESQVYLVGDFNEWRREHMPMRRTSEGVWKLIIRIPPGQYEFRYYCDGKWFTDYAAFGVSINDYGQLNALLYIPPEPEPLRVLPSYTPLSAPAPVAAAMA